MPERDSNKVSKLIQSCDLSKAMTHSTMLCHCILPPSSPKLFRIFTPLQHKNTAYLRQHQLTRIRVGANERLFQGKDLERVIIQGPQNSRCTRHHRTSTQPHQSHFSCSQRTRLSGGALSTHVKPFDSSHPRRTQWTS
jgi:hypothetical protein